MCLEDIHIGEEGNWFKVGVKKLPKIIEKSLKYENPVKMPRPRHARPVCDAWVWKHSSDAFTASSMARALVGRNVCWFYTFVLLRKFNPQHVGLCCWARSSSFELCFAHRFHLQISIELYFNLIKLNLLNYDHIFLKFRSYIQTNIKF